MVDSLCPVSFFDRIFSKNLATLQIYREADLVISVGGGYIQGPYFNELAGRLAELLTAQRLGKKVYIVAQSLGPFGEGRLRRLSKKVLNGCTFIAPREEISQQRLADLGITAPVKIMPDTAFLLSFDDFSNNALKLVAYECGDFHGENYITVSVRSWAYLSKQKNDFFQNELAKTLDEIIERTKLRVLFVSMCTNYGGYRMDDRYTAFEVWRRMKNRYHSHVLVEEYDAYGIGSILKGSQLHLGMRLHSDILSSVVNTVCVAIEYEKKTTGIMKQLGLSKYVIAMDKVTSDVLIPMLIDAMDSREHLALRLVEKLDVMRKDAFQIIEEMMEE